MVREELKWQNIHADDLPAEVKKSFDAMVDAEAAFKADVETLLKTDGHMPEDKFLVVSRTGRRLGLGPSVAGHAVAGDEIAVGVLRTIGRRLGVAYTSTPRGEDGAGSLKFKTK